jgi:hypothetical protein
MKDTPKQLCLAALAAGSLLCWLAGIIANVDALLITGTLGMLLNIATWAIMLHISDNNHKSD